MPWISIGRFSFDLAEVVLVARGIKAAEAGGGQESVTISLRCGKDVELVGDEARLFLTSFAEFTASRTLGKPPPEVLASPVTVVSPPQSHGSSRGSSTGALQYQTPSL